MNVRERYSIEPAAEADREQVLRLLQQCDLPADGLAEHFGACLVARREKAVAGSIALEVYGSSALLRSLAVDEADRGCGLGKALTGAVMDMAARRQITDVYLLTETASEFFVRQGFASIDRQDVPDTIKVSVEFTTACPQSALAMHRQIRPI